MKAPERTLSERMRKHADKTEMRCPRWYPKSLRSAWREAWNASRDLMRAWADEVSALEQERDANWHAMVVERPPINGRDRMATAYRCSVLDGDEYREMFVDDLYVVRVGYEAAMDEAARILGAVRT